MSENAKSPEKTREILLALEQLPQPADLEKVEALTNQLAQTLATAPELRVVSVREAYLRALGGNLSSPARFFDTAVAATKAEGPSAGGSAALQGQPVGLENPPPWAEPVDGAEWLEDVESIFRRHVVLEDGGAILLALWVAHTYVFDGFAVTPRLAITSPEKRCGKTLVLTLLQHLVSRPLLAANATAASVFRCVESSRPTLLLDEADTFLDGKEELRGILNSGHQRNGTTLRVAGDQHEARAFSTFSPCAIAKIGKLPDTLADRSLAIRMARMKATEDVERFRLDRVDHLDQLRQRGVRWAEDHRDRLKEFNDPPVPEELNARAADNWRPLLAIADAIGGRWPEASRQVAAGNKTTQDDGTSPGTLLLQDLRDLFVGRSVDRLTSASVVEALGSMEERPWPEWRRGQPISARQVARLLSDYGPKPATHRFGDKTARGYLLEDFEEVFARYLPPPIHNKRNKPVDSVTYSDCGSVTGHPPVTDPQFAEKPANSRVVTHVTDRERVSGSEKPQIHLREVFEL